MDLFLGFAACGVVAYGVWLAVYGFPSTINPLPGQRWILPGAGVIEIVARSEGYVEYVIGVYRHDVSLRAFRQSRPTLLA